MVAIARGCQHRLQSLHALHLTQCQPPGKSAASEAEPAPSKADATTQTDVASETCKARSQPVEPAAEPTCMVPGKDDLEDDLCNPKPCLLVEDGTNLVRSVAMRVAMPDCRDGASCSAVR